MWSKKEQIILWTTAYFPLLFLMIAGFLYENDLLPLWLQKKNVQLWFTNQWLGEALFIVIVLVLSILLYRIVIMWLLAGIEQKLISKSIGTHYAVRHFEKLSASEYSFFLITLLLPRIALDYSSIMNVALSLLVIIFIISVYVKTDTISSCPLFFVSGRQVLKGIISEHTFEEEQAHPAFRRNVIFIVREKDLNLSTSYRGQHLVSNMYMIAKEKTIE